MNIEANMEMANEKTVASVLFDWSNRPFVYEADNCCEFVGEVLEVMHGRNPMQAFHYETKREAIQAILQHGSLVDAINHTLGPSVPFSEPFTDGDVVVCIQPDKSWIAGVVIGERIAVKTEQSIMDWPLSRAIYRWRMPSCRKQ